jgi:hypothetical protein
MAESEYRQNQVTKRLFGQDARLCGSIGSARGPGHIEIRANGRTLGTGRTFEQALQDTSRRQREVAACR